MTQQPTRGQQRGNLRWGTPAAVKQANLTSRQPSMARLKRQPSNAFQAHRLNLLKIRQSIETSMVQQCRARPLEIAPERKRQRKRLGILYRAGMGASLKVLRCGRHVRQYRPQ